MKIPLFSPLKAVCASSRELALSTLACVILFSVPMHASADTPAHTRAHAKAAAHKKPPEPPHPLRVHARQSVEHTAGERNNSFRIIRIDAPVAREPASVSHHRIHRQFGHQTTPVVMRSTLISRAFGWQPSPEHLALRSNIAYVVDQNTGKPLFDKNSAAVVPIASITKLMMAMVVLDSKASLTEPITVTDEDRDYIKMTGSRLAVGSTLNRADMLHIALMASENRAAAALSRYYPGGRPGFIAAMNEKARVLGMPDTHFESPNGLTSQNVSSARDLVKMVEAAYQYPLIRTYSTDLAYEVNPGNHLMAYHSTNALVRNPTWTIGLQKTGYIDEAGICLVMQTTIEGRPVVMVLLDSTGKYSDFADAGKLRQLVLADDHAHLAAIEPGRDGQ